VADVISVGGALRHEVHAAPAGALVRRAGAILALVGVLGLTGCVSVLLPDPYPEIPRDAPSGGQTLEELHAKLESIDGLVVEEAAGSKPNIKGNTGFGYRLSLDPDYVVADGPALVDFLVESAWSVRDGYMPNTSIELSFLGVPGDDFRIGQATIDAGWAPVGTLVRDLPSNAWSDASVWIDSGGEGPLTESESANQERLGEWPGDAPEVPASAIMRRES